jgi:hypothetical protein
MGEAQSSEARALEQRRVGEEQRRVVGSRPSTEVCFSPLPSEIDLFINT